MVSVSLRPHIRAAHWASHERRTWAPSCCSQPSLWTVGLDPVCAPHSSLLLIIAAWALISHSLLCHLPSPCPLFLTWCTVSQVFPSDTNSTTISSLPVRSRSWNPPARRGPLYFCCFPSPLPLGAIPCWLVSDPRGHLGYCERARAHFFFFVTIGPCPKLTFIRQGVTHAKLWARVKSLRQFAILHLSQFYVFTISHSTGMGRDDLMEAKQKQTNKNLNVSMCDPLAMWVLCVRMNQWCGRWKILKDLLVWQVSM